MVQLQYISPLKDISEGNEGEGQWQGVDEISGYRKVALFLLHLNVLPADARRKPVLLLPQPLIYKGLHPEKRREQCDVASE